jgi:hypothetical protein
MAEINQPAESKKKSVRTSADVFGVLCGEIENWVAGKGDAVRSSAICKLVSTQVSLARVQMEANQHREDCAGIPLLESGESADEDEAVERLSALSKELAVIDKALDGELPEAQRGKLEAKRNNVQQEIMLLERPRRAGRR